MEVDDTSGVKYRNRAKRGSSTIMSVSPVAWAISQNDFNFIEEPNLLIDCRANRNGMLKECYPYDPLRFITQLFAGEIVLISRDVFEQHFVKFVTDKVVIESRVFTDDVAIEKLKMLAFVAYVRNHEMFDDTNYAYSFANCIEMECENGGNFYGTLYNEFDNKVYSLTVIRDIMSMVCGKNLAALDGGGRKNGKILNLIVREFLVFVLSWTPS